MLDVENRLGNIRCDNDVDKCPSVFLEEVLSGNWQKSFYSDPVTQYRGKQKRLILRWIILQDRCYMIRFSS